MAPKDTVKHWVSLIDDALRKDAKRARQHDSAPPSPPGGARQTLSEPLLQPDSSAALRPENADETDNISLLRAIESLSRQTSTPIDISADIYSLMSPNDIQITSPHVIEAGLLQPFATGEREVTFVFLGTQKIVPATVKELHYNHMFADVVHSTLPHKTGERLLILFPVLPDKRYVLQAVVDTIYPGRLKLRYQDPRYDVRRHFPLAEPVLLRLVRPAVVTAIAQERVRLMRDIAISPCATPPAPRGSVTDRLYDVDTATVSPHMQTLEQIRPVSCSLYDISPGGMCLTFPAGYRSEELLQRVTHLQILLPPTASCAGQEECLPFVLAPFGVVRHVKTASRPWLLHMRFLKRLPQECDVLLAYVAQQYEAQQPL